MQKNVGHKSFHGKGNRNQRYIAKGLGNLFEIKASVGADST